MIEIKFHGRGGQGAVIASQILAKAYFFLGAYPQCYALFGSERRGAPVTSFLRVDDKKILLKCEIKRPDQIVYLAADQIDAAEIATTLKPGGLCVINTSAPPENFPFLRKFKLVLVDASAVAEEAGLGGILNTAILGAYCKANPAVPLDCLERSISDMVPAKVELNLSAARRAYDAAQVIEPRAQG
jgi:2-oxoacid:acceptor oxidoreductase gamma subunit (pyruvate/2-ketoisovalerate family)